MPVTTRRAECIETGGGRLLMAIELGRQQWTLGFTTGVGQRPRRRTLATAAWDLWRYLDAGVIPEGALLKGRGMSSEG